MNILNLEEYLRKFNEINIDNKIPLIKYTKDYPLPNKLEFEEYETTLINRGENIKIKRYRLIGLAEDLKNQIKAKRFYKGDKNRRGLKYIIKENKIWFVLRENWPSNNLHLDKEVFFEGDYLYFKVQEGYIGVWYNNSLSTEFVILPKYLDLKNSFWDTYRRNE